MFCIGPLADSAVFEQPVFAEPALFAIEYALAEMWRDWGIEPSAVLGHGLGEYVAACVAGVFSLEDGLRLVSARARLKRESPRDGGMLAVRMDEERIRDLLPNFRVSRSPPSTARNRSSSRASEVLNRVLKS